MFFSISFFSPPLLILELRRAERDEELGGRRSPPPDAGPLCGIEFGKMSLACQAKSPCAKLQTRVQQTPLAVIQIRFSDAVFEKVPLACQGNAPHAPSASRSFEIYSLKFVWVSGFGIWKS
jgi:hypothetical protein